MDARADDSGWDLDEAGADTVAAPMETPVTDEKPSRFDRRLVTGLRVVCLLGLALANYYGWTMTVTGLVNTRLIPDNSVLPNTLIPHLVAGFVQLGILSFYLSIPYFQRQNWIVNTVASVFAATLVLVSVLFALFSITFTSQSGNLVAHQFDLIGGMNKTIVQLDDVVTTTFNGYIGDLDALAERACQGKDRSGVARCGSIWQDYIEKANAVREGFGAQLGAAGSYAGLGASDIMDDFTSLRSNYVKLTQKISVFEDFARANNLSSNAVSRSFAALNTDIDAFGASMNEKNPDAKTLVLNRVLGDLGKMWAGLPEPLVYLALVIALLPDLLSMTFAMILLISRRTNYQTISLRRVVKKTRDLAKWYARYATARESLDRATQRWRRRRQPPPMMAGGPEGSLDDEETFFSLVPDRGVKP